VVDSVKKIYGVVAVLLICAAVGLPAASLPAEAGTLDALPAWDEPHVVVHVEDVSKTLSRLGSSYLFDKLLDEDPLVTSYREQVRNQPEMLSAL
jgi:hypothetical protein